MNGRFVLAIQPGNLHIQFFFYFHHNQNFHFLTNGKDITASLRLRSTTSILLLCCEAIIMVNKGFLNKNIAITQQLIRTGRTLGQNGGKFAGKSGYRDKGR